MSNHIEEIGMSTMIGINYGYGQWVWTMGIENHYCRGFLDNHFQISVYAYMQIWTNK